MHKLPAAGRRGFSLIELLCVLTIILILASLTAGPVLRAYRHAKDLKVSFEGSTTAELMRKRLKAFFVPRAKYPPYSPEELHRRGVFDSEMMRRIRTQEVLYFPFSSSDPEDKVIAVVQVERSTKSTNYQAILKQDLYAEEQ